MNKRWNCCPRCKGDVRLDRDQYGWYEECLMCGYLHDVENEVAAAQYPPEQHVAEKVKVRVKRAA